MLGFSQQFDRPGCTTKRSLIGASAGTDQAPGYSELTVHTRAVNPSGKYPRNRIAFYFTGGSVSVSGAYAPPMTGRAVKLVDWMIVSYKSGNGLAEVLVFA
jgi:hypothetical protein